MPSSGSADQRIVNRKDHMCGQPEQRYASVGSDTSTSGFQDRLESSVQSTLMKTDDAQELFAPDHVAERPLPSKQQSLMRIAYINDAREREHPKRFLHQTVSPSGLCPQSNRA
eukprot:TRINITY_DN25144_c0_g1_i1.p1 TRINITY_DN25144_c0_g1~~TRINITY_DN25144_c0_g1_i1.p1  ORF type:complete len:113 (+),score=11.30 TRINITY_DN25144_c0_g1_i1:390-728(+)